MDIYHPKMPLISIKNGFWEGIDCDEISLGTVENELYFR
jgi:hypothetical protein